MNTELRHPPYGFVYLLLLRARTLRLVGVFAEACAVERDWFHPVAPFLHGTFPAAGRSYTDCRVPASSDPLSRRHYSLREVPRLPWMEIDLAALQAWEEALKTIRCDLPPDGFCRW